MATFYCKPIGYGKPGGTGQTEDEAFDGWTDVQTRGLALTASGDTIRFLPYFGTYTLSEYTINLNPLLVTQAIPANTLRGPTFGSNQGASSTAAGRIFDFRGCKIDFRGISTNAQRMNAAMIFRGERITVLIEGMILYTGDWNYLFDDATGVARAPWTAGMGTGDATLAEQASWENGGIIIAGNGCSILGGRARGLIDGAAGNSGWCRHALMMYVSHVGVGGTTAGLTNTIQGVEVAGCMTGISVTMFGTGGANALQFQTGQEVYVYDNYARDPCWGWPIYKSKFEYSAGQHGNGIEVTGQSHGRGFCFNNRVTGDWQDGIDMGGAGQWHAFNNELWDLGNPFIRQWKWDTTGTVTGTPNRWWIDYRASSEGNGFKAGLNNEGTGHAAPTSWLGADGTKGTDALQADEARNKIYKNIIRGCNRAGITTNSGKGLYAHANEIDDVSIGINLDVAGNHCVTHNYIRLRSGLAATASTHFWCIYMSGGATRRYILENNILDSNLAGNPSFCYELFYGASLNIISKTGNVYVTNRFEGSPAADTKVNAPPAGNSLVWTPRRGLAAGHSYLTAGAPDTHVRSRSPCAEQDRNGRRFNCAAPPVGPYAPEFTRTARP